METLDLMPRRHPVNATLELTLRCNLHCKMCMLRHRSCEDASLMAEELTASQWIDMARQLAEAGTLNLLITGGEPLLRKDFREIYTGIYRLGFLITLYTNATLVDEALMETLRKYPPHKIGITLYGASNETYGALCGQKDGFDRALAGVKMLATLPSVLEFRTTLVQENVQELEAMEQLVEKEFGQTLTHSTTVFKSVRGGCMSPEHCRLSAEEMVSLYLDRVVKRVRQSLPEEQLAHLQLSLGEPQPDCIPQKAYSLLGCSGGMDTAVITYQGKLQGCQLVGCFATDAVKSGFAKAWEQWPYTVRLPELDPQCAACKHLSDCRICPGSLMAECGDLQGHPEYICEFTKAFAAKRGENLL